MTFDHTGHNHETREAKLACDTVQELSHITRGLPVGVVVVAEAGPDDEAHPYVSLRGNVTDFAHMVRAMIDAATSGARPNDCIACMANFDALLRARAALDAMVGNC